jgi:gamma-glutamylcyclotransferase (GGCT)/AIG2-like uncharacterized protein YtfP
MNSLFVYGELCKPAVLREVLGRVPCAEPALLAGYARLLSPETGYFRAVASNDALIVGLLFVEIADDEIEVLDDFENVGGGEYERVTARVKTLGSDRERRAWVYVGSVDGKATAPARS